jgi:uncharacterized membrane protein YqjE
VSRDADLASGEREKRQESVPELVKDLTRDISELVRQEIELARVEMTEKGKQAGLGFGMFGGAALLGMAVVGGSMATVIILLDLAMPLWLASLVTTVLYAAAAALLALRGRDELKETGAPIPERTKQSVKEDIQWAKMRAQSKDKERTPASGWATPSPRSHTRPTSRGA